MARSGRRRSPASPSTEWSDDSTRQGDELRRCPGVRRRRRGGGRSDDGRRDHAGLQLYPFDVNDGGAAIGLAFRGNEVFKFLWQNGVLTNIDQAAAGAFSEVVAINNRGEIAGYGPGRSLLQALLWDGQVTRAVGDPSTTNVAYGLNDLGDVAGSSNRSGAVWTNGRTIELGPTRGYTIALASAVNDGGDVAGNVTVSSTPFVWQAVFWPGATPGRTGGAGLTRPGCGSA